MKKENVVKSKFYKTSSVSQLGEKSNKLTDQLRSQSYNLTKRLSRDENKTLEPLSTLTEQAPRNVNKPYSKNAYLASLNYDFSNPLF